MKSQFHCRVPFLWTLSSTLEEMSIAHPRVQLTITEFSKVKISVTSQNTFLGSATEISLKINISNLFALCKVRKKWESMTCCISVQKLKQKVALNSDILIKYTLWPSLWLRTGNKTSDNCFWLGNNLHGTTSRWNCRLPGKSVQNNECLSLSEAPNLPCHT